jgi:hypothetical protein
LVRNHAASEAAFLTGSFPTVGTADVIGSAGAPNGGLSASVANTRAGTSAASASASEFDAQQWAAAGGALSGGARPCSAGSAAASGVGAGTRAFFTAAGVFVEGGVAAADAFVLSGAASRPGPLVIAACLQDPVDVKLRRKAVRAVLLPKCRGCCTSIRGAMAVASGGG